MQLATEIRISRGIMKIANRIAVASIVGALACTLAGCTPTPGGQTMATYLNGQWSCKGPSENDRGFTASFGDGNGTYASPGNGSYTLKVSTVGDQLLIQNNAGQSFTITAKNGVPVGGQATFEYSAEGGNPQKVSAQIESDTKVKLGKPGTDSQEWTECTKS